MKTFVHSKLYDYVLDLHFCYVGDINIQVLKVVEVWHLHYFLVSLHSILSVLVIFDKIRFPHFSLYPNYKPSLWFLNWKLIPHHLFLKSNLVESSQILDFIGHEHISLAVIRDHVVYCKMTPNPFNPSDQSMLFSFATWRDSWSRLRFSPGVNDLVLIWGPIFITMQWMWTTSFWTGQCPALILCIKRDTTVLAHPWHCFTTTTIF